MRSSMPPSTPTSTTATSGTTATIPTAAPPSLWRLLLPSRALLLALVLLLFAELAVRLLVPNLGWYEGLSSFTQWVDRLRYELRTQRPDTWFLGNSVLAYGVDVDQYAAETGHTALALPFGGATFQGEIAMLEYFLRRAPVAPSNVIFCLTKDDFNPNGERAFTSRKYLEFDTWRGLSFDRVFKLAGSRNTIMNTLKSAILRRPTAAAKNPSEPSFHGVIPPEKFDFMAHLMKDYAFDPAPFDHLADLARKYHFSVRIVLVPVARAYLDFHDAARPDLPAADIHAAASAAAAAHSFAFSDFSQAFPDDLPSFSDPYHLTALGRSRLTSLLASACRFSLPREEGAWHTEETVSRPKRLVRQGRAP